MQPSNLYIGLMSGTSLDGVNAVLVAIDVSGRCRMLGQQYSAFDQQLRAELLALNSTGSNEIERSQLLGNQLARCYARAVSDLLSETGHHSSDVIAIGCHGQTIRHRPELGYTVQIGNAALLAELSGICVVADFRSRDIAAGGQGAPLVPAFHQAAFGDAEVHRVVVNIGGISNLSSLPPSGAVSGFDCGPGNLLMDGWIQRHQGKNYDAGGAWAASGCPIPELLAELLTHPFFVQAPPKSTGRDNFHLAWLESHLRSGYSPADVQATLLELTTRSIADNIDRHCAGASEIYLCGGGAHNQRLFTRLQAALPGRLVTTTDVLGITADWVEAAAFAWFAQRALAGQPANLPAVTGARGPRILGAIYPA